MGIKAQSEGIPGYAYEGYRMTEVCDYCGKQLDPRMEKWEMRDQFGRIICYRLFCCSCADHLRHYCDWRKYKNENKRD